MAWQNIKTAKRIYARKGGLELLKAIKKYFYRHYISKILSRILKINFIDRYCFSKSFKEIKEIRSTNSLDKLIQKSYDYKGYGLYKKISPVQNPLELKEIAQLASEINAERVLEIGTDRGGTFLVWTNYLDPNVAVSLDKNYSKISKSDISYGNSRKELYKTFNEDLYTIEGNSHNNKTFERVKSVFDQNIDFLFIDGDHSYEGVKKDFEIYSEIVSEEGIIAFHDIRHPDTGVFRFWKEIKSKYKTEEIYYSESGSFNMDNITESRRKTLKQNGGIGVVYASDIEDKT